MIHIFILVVVAASTASGLVASSKKNSQDPEVSQQSAQQLVDSAIARKSEIAQKLVKRAIAYIQEKGLIKACADMHMDPSWQEEEMRPWICDTDGYMYVYGQDDRIIWRDLDAHDPHHGPKISRLEEVARRGGFCNFLWNNSYCRAYVHQVIVNGKTYIVGASLYPASAIYIIDELVSSAMSYLASSNIKDLCERINNPTGSLVRGDIHLSIFDMRGTCLADGEQLAFVGQNLMDATTGDKKYLVRDAIDIARTKGQGWYSFIAINNNAPAKMFVKKIIDPTDKREYVLTAGYYPGVDNNTVMTVVKNAINYLKAHGREIAFRDFTSQPERFAHGNIHVFVYDLSGKMMADSANPAFVGLNLIGSRDTQGRYITRQIIDAANKYNRGWVTNNLRNSYQVSYVEKVKVPDGDYVVGAAYYPIAKESTVTFMVKDAELLIKNDPLQKVLNRFSSYDIDFIKGDLHISVYTQDGVCLAAGLDRSALWSSIKDLKDDKGKPMFDEILAYAKSGGGWLNFSRYQGAYRMYVKGIRMNGLQSSDELFILCSGYYE
jgi:cytochrome c